MERRTMTLETRVLLAIKEQKGITSIELSLSIFGDKDPRSRMRIAKALCRLREKNKITATYPQGYRLTVDGVLDNAI